MVITLSGDDNARLTSRLQTCLDQYLPDDTASLNLLELDGGEVTVETLRAACDAMPFLGEHRVVLVKGLLNRFADKDAADGSAKSATTSFLRALKEYLPQVPDTTALIFLERRKLGAGAVANLLRGAGQVEEFAMPSEAELPAYIVKMTRNRGASIDRDAAALLAEAIADEPRRLESELEKLVAYRSGDSPLTAADVHALVNIPLEVAIWDLTDALHAHNAPASIAALRSLIERGQAPQQITAAIASQLRNITVAEEFKAAGPDRLAAATGMKPFVARKSIGALRNFKPGEPRRVLAALMDLDLRVKTGKAEINSALEFLILQTCARRL